MKIPESLKVPNAAVAFVGLSAAIVVAITPPIGFTTFMCIIAAWANLCFLIDSMRKDRHD